MTKMTTAHDFPEVYKDLDINLNELQCVMFDTVTLPDFTIDSDLLYYANDPAKFWIDGQICDKTPHITALYGLLPCVRRKHVNAVLSDIPQRIFLNGLEIFQSPFESEPYECIVATVAKTSQVMRMHKELQMLPHICTYLDYKPHLTIAYVHKGKADDLLPDLWEAIDNRRTIGGIDVVGINYGYMQ